MHRDQRGLRIVSAMWNEESLDRRQLLKRSAALALSVPVVGTLLAACGSDDDAASDSNDSAGSGATSDEPTATSGSTSEDEPTSEAEATPSDEPTTEADSTPAGSPATETGEGTYGGTINTGKGEKAGFKIVGKINRLCIKFKKRIPVLP